MRKMKLILYSSAEQIGQQGKHHTMKWDNLKKAVNNANICVINNNVPFSTGHYKKAGGAGWFSLTAK